MFRKYIPLKHGIPLLKKDKVKTIFPITSCWLAQDLGHRSRPTFFAGSKLVIVSSRLELFWILQLQESNNIELSTISVSNYLMSSSFFRSHFKEFPVTPCFNLTALKERSYQKSISPYWYFFTLERHER